MMFSLVTASALSTCLCSDSSYCAPLTTPLATTEVLAFAPRVDAWKEYEIDALTTIVKFGNLSDVPELVCAAHAKGVRVTYSTAFDATKLNDSSAISAFVKEVTTTVSDLHLDGFNFDVEQSTSDAKGLSILVKSVSESLRAANPLAQISFDSGIYGNLPAAYNFSEIAPHIDFFVPMGYDMCWGTSTAEPNSPIAGVEKGMSDYKNWGYANKTVLGLPWYGWNFPCTEAKPSGGCPVVKPFAGAAWQKCNDDITALISNATVQPKYTDAGDAVFFSYELEGVPHQVYYDDSTTLTKKYNLVPQFGLRGIAIWYAGCAIKKSNENTAMWKALAQVKNQQH